MNHSSEIYNLSSECEHAFIHLLKLTDASAPQAIDTLYQRFHQWASYLGVFAEERMSMDARLASSDTMPLRDMVLQLLNIIKRNLETFVNYDGTIQWDILADCPVGSKDNEQQQVVSSTAETLQALDVAMDSLYRLGIAIRQTSTRDPTTKISSFMENVDHDHRLRNCFLVMVKHSLKDQAQNAGREDGPPVSLCEQLAASICFRYCGILYHRDRQQTLESVRESALRSPEAGSSEDVRPGTPDHPNTSFPGMPHKAGRNPLGSKSVSEGPTVPNPPLALTRFHSQSVVGDASTVSIPLPLIEYPVPPKILPPAKHVPCPYCTKPIGKGIVTSKLQWERHVNDDLKLYACISERCADPPQLFARYSDWKQHMEEHSPRWAEEVHLGRSWCCDSGHDALYFTREIDFEAHVQIKHPECDTASEVAELTDWCEIKPKRKPYTCPLCCCVPREIDLIISSLASNPAPGSEAPIFPTRSAESGLIPEVHDADFRRKLSKHVAEHLKGIGLMSLRYLDDGSEGGSAETKGAATSITGVGRLEEDIPTGLLDADFVGYTMPQPPVSLDGDVFELDSPTILDRSLPRRRSWTYWTPLSMYYRQRQDNEGNEQTEWSKMVGSEFHDDFPDFHSEEISGDVAMGSKDMTRGEKGRQTPDFPSPRP